MLFRDFVSSQWEPAILPTLKFATQRNYRHLTRRHLFPVFGDQPMCDIRRQHIQGFVMEKMLRQGFSWKTSLHLRNLVSKIFTTAVDWDYVPVNPARGVKLPQRPLRQPLRFLTVGEVTRLLEALREPERTLVLTAVLTGMRIGELLALRWRNVDLERKVIRVREAVYEGHNSTPKTQGSVRDVPMGPALEHALRSMVRVAELQMIHSSSPVATELICDPEICTSATCIRHARRRSSDVSVGMTSDERMRRCLATWANR